MIAEFGGLSSQMPIYATLFMIITMSSIGLPALNGFIGEFTILVGAFRIPPAYGFSIPWLGNLHIGGMFWAVCGTLGFVLGAAYMLWLYQRTMVGKLDNPQNAGLKDLDLREIKTPAPNGLCRLWVGVVPEPVFRVPGGPWAESP